MLKRLPIVLLLAAACSQELGDVDKETLNNIFGPPPVSNLAQPTVSTTVPPVNPNKTASEDNFSCKMSDGQDGVCVIYYLCNKFNNTVITDGTGIFDERFTSSCPSYTDVCCLLADKMPLDQPLTPKPKPIEPQRKGCGWANPEGVDPRITSVMNGKTQFGEFPWMVVILKIGPVNESEANGPKLKGYVGGGSLIHPSIVLTTAHYLVAAKTRNFKIRAGEWDTRNTKEIYPFQERDVSSVEIHEDFNGGNLFYDIAVLFLAQPMDLAPNVGVACLPPAGASQQHGKRCIATGWGKDKFGKEGQYQDVLKKVKLSVLKRDECQTALRKTRLGRFFLLHSTFMCGLEDSGRETCTGDGGSPVFCPTEGENDRYVQNGMVAWSIGCGANETPAVYVDVSVLRNWIDDKIIGKGYSPDTYTI